jgi:hypothetical protein
MESQINKSFVPLESGRAYVGTYEDVSEYGACIVSLYSDKVNTITIHQSQNMNLEYTQTFTTVANTQFTQNIELTSPFVYFTVRNASSTTETVMAFTVLYKVNFQQTIGTTRQSNQVWNNASVVTGGVSSILNLDSTVSQNVSVYGNSNLVGKLTVQFSADGTTFYSSQYSYTLTVAGNYGFTIPVSASYCRLQWTGSTSTITAFMESC